MDPYGSNLCCLKVNCNWNLNSGVMRSYLRQWDGKPSFASLSYGDWYCHKHTSRGCKKPYYLHISCFWGEQSRSSREVRMAWMRARKGDSFGVFLWLGSGAQWVFRTQTGVWVVWFSHRCQEGNTTLAYELFQMRGAGELWYLMTKMYYI